MYYCLLHHAQTVPARRGFFRIGFFLAGLLLLFCTEGWSQEFRRLDQEQTPPEFATREEWLARAHELRTRIMVSAGLEPLPARTPLDPRLSPPLTRDGYTVRNVSLETLPGFYLTGNLYRPLGIDPPFPAILGPHGHWKNGRLEHSELSSVPGRAINLARRGAVVFTYSMIGYEENKDLIPHRFDEPRYQLWGFGPLGLQLWNSLRALDFLISMTDVDPGRIGMTGASGGGTQTFLLMAVDPRIAVAAPVNMISAHYQGGCICENAPLLRLDLVNTEIGAMMAPRPLMLVSTSGDWTSKTPDVEFPAIRSVYRLFGAEERVANAHFDYPHNYNRDSREAVYGWFGKWLWGEERFREEPFQVEPTDALKAVLPAPPLPLEELFSNFAARARGQIEIHKPRDWEGIFRYREVFGPVLRHSLAVPPSPGSIGMEVLLPDPHHRAGRAVLVVHPREQEERARELARRYRDEGRLAFRTSPYPQVEALIPPEDVNHWTTYNPTPAARRIAQVRRACREILDRGDVTGLDLVGLGEAGAWVLLGAATGPPVGRVTAELGEFSGDTDQIFLDRLNVPLLRRAGDLKTAAVLLAPQRLSLHGLGEGPLKLWFQDVYRAAGAGGILELRSAPIGE